MIKMLSHYEVMHRFLIERLELNCYLLYFSIVFFFYFCIAATSMAKERKQKCASEQYVRERKSNAQKQFAYNKLKNEKQMTLKHEQSKSSTAPKRPPQPKHINVDKKDKEGMLIDLSSPQAQPTHDIASALPKSNGFDCSIGGGGGGGGSDNVFMPKLLNGMSILDTPIEVPTQGYANDESHTVDYFTNEPNKLEPPPYTQPPNYMNTYAISKSDRKYAPTTITTTTATNQYGNLDPFDTSHIGPGASHSINSTIPTFTPYTADLSASHRLDTSFIQNPIPKMNYMDLAASTAVQSNRSSATAELDEIVQNKMASLSPKRSVTPIQQTATTTSAANSTLSDSLKVNLSSLTLNDTDDFENTRTSIACNASMSEQQQNPKLDRAFLAELEKEMYKCDQANVNVNNVNALKNDDVTTAAGGGIGATVAPTTIGNPSAFNWFKNDITTNSGSHYATQSPAKIYNNEPTIMTKLTNYESTATNMTLSKKLFNTDANNAEPSGYSSTASASFKYTKTLNNLANSSNASSTYANASGSDNYGSIAGGGNIYDMVASSGSSDYYQIIQPNDSQTVNTNLVIYDEVAADDIMRPHRPAPGPPPSSSGLSAQQIQRRIERAQKGQSQQQIYDNLHATYANGFAANANQYIYEEIMQKNCNSGSEAKETINAASSEQMKNMKIDHLLR